MAKKSGNPIKEEVNEEVNAAEVDDAEVDEEEADDEEDVDDDEASGEPIVVKLPPHCRVNEPIIYQLDILLDFVHPRRLKKDLTEVLLLYLVHECENLSGNFKETAENYLLLFQWLDTVEKEMDERGFE